MYKSEAGVVEVAAPYWKSVPSGWVSVKLELLEPTFKEFKVFEVGVANVAPLITSYEYDRPSPVATTGLLFMS
jgi:hypothetical protein